MIALVVLGVVVVWGLLGLLVWRLFLKSRFSSILAKVSVFFLFAAVWLVTPVLDEILGAREFERLCQEIPERKFHGPVPVGVGELFDENGNPRWSNIREFRLVRLNTGSFKKIFDSRSDWHLLTRWPMPIGELHSLHFDLRSGKPVAESFKRYSAGGWIKRGLGIGGSAYQCPPKGDWPGDQDWIYFDAAQVNGREDK